MIYNKLYIFKEYNLVSLQLLFIQSLTCICRAPTIQVNFSWQNKHSTAHAAQCSWYFETANTVCCKTPMPSLSYTNPGEQKILTKYCLEVKYNKRYQ